MRELLLVAFVLFVFVWFQEGPVSVPGCPGMFVVRLII